MTVITIAQVFVLMQCMIVICQQSNAVTWIPDLINFDIQTSSLQNQKWANSIKINSNGLIYAPDGGNFRILLSTKSNDYHNYLGVSSCIPVGSTQTDFSQILQNMSVIKKHVLDTTVQQPSDLLSETVIQFCTKHDLFVPFSSIFSSNTKKYSSSSGKFSFTNIFIKVLQCLVS